MALSGQQKAYTQARSGLARAGATRSGYYFPNVVITIDRNGVPFDVTPYVAYNGWSVNLNLNDDVDTASLSLLPTCPFIPQTRSQIKIGLGAINNLTFAGIVLTVQRTRRPGPDPRYWYDLTCIDWTAIFDAHLIVASYPAQSATATILDIVTRFTRGNFTTEGVALNMPVVEAMEVVNERPSTVVRRLTNLVGGGFYIDTARRLRAWSASIPSPIQESSPQPLTDTRTTLKQFRIVEDASQQRTRVLVEGGRTATLLGVPNLPLGTLQELPVGDASLVHQWSAGNLDRYVRIGTQYAQAGQVFNPTLDASKNPPGTTTTFATAIEDGSVLVVDASLFPSGGFCKIGDQIVRFSKFSATTLLIPKASVSNYGSLQTPVSVGTQVVLLPNFLPDPQDRVNAVGAPYIWTARVVQRAQADDTPVVLVSMQQDRPTAEAIAAREGSDGYLEHLVQDGRYTSAGALARAARELTDFAQPTVTYEWETEDFNAEPGRDQMIAMTLSEILSVIVRITNVTVTPIASNYPPIRQVRATKIQPAGVLDVWVEETR